MEVVIKIEVKDNNVEQALRVLKRKLQKDGFFKIWINGKLKYHWKGATQHKGERTEFHVGVYRSFIHRTPEPDPTQIAYYDEIRIAKSCKKLKLKDLGYTCQEIESQSLK